MGKTQMPMMSRDWEGSAPFGPLNSFAGRLVTQAPSCEGQRICLQTPGGQTRGSPWSRTGAWPTGPPYNVPHHPSLVLTAGIGLPGAPPPLSVTLVLAPGGKGSDVPPAAGEKQAGTVGPAQTQLWKRREQGQRSVDGWHRALGKC